MRVTFPKTAIALALAFGVIAMTFIFLQLHAPASRHGVVSSRVTCTSVGPGMGCADSGSVIQLGTVVVTPTPAQQRYLVSHGMIRMSPTANLGRSTATPLADMAASRFASNAMPIPPGGRRTGPLPAGRLAHVPAAA